MKNLPNKYAIPLAIFSGAILPIAFAPINFFPIAYISPAILLFILMHSTKIREFFFRGWCFGIGFFGVGVSWIYVSIHQFGNSNIFLAAIITVIFIMYLSLFPALLSTTFKYLNRKKQLFSAAILIFPALFIVFEYLRSWVFSGFPWLFLGYTQLSSSLRGFFPIVGIYGTSLITVIISGCLYLIFCDIRLRSKLSCAMGILILFVAGYGLQQIRWTHNAGKSLRIALIQGNISPSVKWNINDFYHTLSIYQSETEKNWDSQIIVWPEAAIPAYLFQVKSLVSSLAQQASAHHSSIIIGIPIYNRTTHQSFNGLIVIGNGHGKYLKHHLVPFGEYIPLISIFGKWFHYFNIPLSNLNAGPKQQSPVTAQGIEIAPYICYEIVYPIEFMNTIKTKQLVVVLSDDAWFGNSIASPQQIQMAQARALESGRYVIYSTNSGVTAIINPLGNVTATLARNRQAVLHGTVIPQAGKTFLMNSNYFPELALVSVMLIVGLLV